MKKEKITTEQEVKTTLLIATSLLFLSLIIFVINEYRLANPKTMQGLWVTNMGIALLFSIGLITRRIFRLFRWKQPNEHIRIRILCLFLWLISCYALNIDMEVFLKSANWINPYLLTVISIFIVDTFWGKEVKLFRVLSFFTLGTFSLYLTYLSIYLFPLYLMSGVLLPALLVSLHTFIPLIFITTILRLFVSEFSDFKFPVFAGIAVGLTLVTLFTIYWRTNSIKVNEAYQETDFNKTDLYPSWVSMSMNLEKSYFTKKILLASLTNFQPDLTFNFIGSLGNNNRFEEYILHDPLVAIASIFSPKIEIPQGDQIKFLQTTYDERHQSIARLWSGIGLNTQKISTQVQLFPKFRMAYTEKTLLIQNRSDEFWRPKEAIYTFYLPEGAAVSSLSLWIEGEERKGILTTKEKATKAYETIVGVESRDPSVVHWQEGNTVKVCVFPCTQAEDRKFKIGITSPLGLENENLIYESIEFKGPSTLAAKEQLLFRCDEDIMSLKLVGKTAIKQDKIVDISPNSAWKVKLKAPPVSQEAFYHNGFKYFLDSPKIDGREINIEKVYLDINSSWTVNEFETVLDHFKNSTILVDDFDLKELDESNGKYYFEKLQNRNFSLFPFYKIDPSKGEIVVTKGIENSPNLSDLSKSIYYANYRFLKEQAIPIINLTDVFSPYQKTLIKLSILNPIQLKNKAFPLKITLTNSENPDAITVPAIGLFIAREASMDSLQKSNAPDHLARLFLYNKAMSDYGSHFFINEPAKPNVMKNLLEANVVSPVSSLVVLERQADYDRFDIQKSKNSLNNATIKKSGAIPEPHEWMLIIALALTFAWIWLKK